MLSKLQEKLKGLYTRLVKKDESQEEVESSKTYPPIKLQQVEWVFANTDLRKKLEKAGIKVPNKKFLRLAVEDETKRRVLKVIDADGSVKEVEVTKWCKWADPDGVEKERQNLLALL